MRGNDAQQRHGATATATSARLSPGTQRAVRQPPRQQTFSQQVSALFTRQDSKAQLRLHPEELGQGAYFALLDDNQRSSRWYRCTKPCPRRAGSRPAHVARTQLAESVPCQSSISSESFAGQQQSSSQQHLPAPNTRTRLALKMT